MEIIQIYMTNFFVFSYILNSNRLHNLSYVILEVKFSVTHIYSTSLAEIFGSEGFFARLILTIPTT